MDGGGNKLTDMEDVADGKQMEHKRRSVAPSNVQRDRANEGHAVATT